MPGSKRLATIHRPAPMSACTRRSWPPGMSTHGVSASAAWPMGRPRWLDAGASVLIAGSDPLEDRAGGDGAAAAHGDEGDLLARALELVQGRGDQAAAGGAHRVTERDRA